ncbi:PREDICTED: uncharacterized protein LOC104598568 isoform X2 [Nelumbo nucifera]|nr:PREDICTED: uncharacterized protein LOC104598568 isoform X2 [Nelumbo nucifera]XP_010259010.1 PREDICTED: uncharacterized protein LOC104598568 isoform X2 [Nelumbo nucifera]
MGLEVLSEGYWQNLVTPDNARSDLGGHILINFHENRMLAGNSVHRYADSFKEFLKQTMLQHEAIFRNQVHELHRLYRIQKTMMKDLSWREFDRYNSWTTNTQSAQLPFKDQPMYRPLVDERAISGPSMVSSTLVANQDLECQGAYSKLKERPFDLQLPADEYISHVDTELPKKMNSLPSIGEFIETKDFLCGGHFSDTKKVKLLANGGEDQNKMDGSSKVWSNKKAPFSAQDVIDLEESNEKLTSTEVKPFCFLASEAPTNYPVDTYRLQVPVLSDPSFSGRMGKGSGNGLFMNHIIANCSKSSEEQTSLYTDRGLNGGHTSSPFISLFSEKQQSSSHSTMSMDLNRVHLDDSSCLSNDLAEKSHNVLQGCSDIPYKGTQHVTTCWKVTDSHSSGTSDVFPQENSAHSALTDSKGIDCRIQACNESNKFKSNNGIKRGAIDLESLPEDALDLYEDLTNHANKACREIVDLSLEPPSSPHNHITDSSTTHVAKLGDHPYASAMHLDFPQVEVSPVNFEKSEEDTVSSDPYESSIVFQEGYSKAFNATSKSNCDKDNNSNSIKDLQSGTEDKHELEVSNLSAFEEFGTTQLGSQVAETHSCEQEPNVETGIYACTQDKSFDCTESEHQYDSQQQKEDNEMDILVQIAAESLVQFSLENSLCSQDCFAKAGSDELTNDERTEQPEYSSDSYESITLRLTESTIEDYSVSSGPVEVNEMEKKRSRWNLKRGRRLKDFQREILPGLVSLSRHEICEDINIIGAVIKSKEYRKNRSRKLIVEDNWCAPVRSRRSKLNYVGRRNYS